MKRTFLILVLIFTCLFSFAEGDPDAVDTEIPNTTEVELEAATDFGERRTALVIGIGAYESAPLRNPENDANDMAVMLASLGFDVTLKINCSLVEMEDAVRDFGDDLLQGGIGLFYYSGHGIQVGGQNYLIPADSNIQREDEIKYNALDASLVLSKMDSAKNELNIFILDACRNNPFERSFRTADRGLSIVGAPNETMIIYSTAPGEVASDGTGRNGTFTKWFLEYLPIPGMEIHKMLIEVKREVSKETNTMQRPWTTDDLTREFYFAGVEGNPEDYIERPIATETTNERESTTIDETESAFITDGLILVEGGTFSMGSNDGETDEQPVHTVKVSSFYMGKYEITNQEVVDVFTHGIESGALFVDSITVKNNYGNKQELLDLDDEDCQIVYSRGRLAVQPGKENNPVIEISWYGAVVFCNLLSEMRGKDPAYNLSDWSCNFTANGYRLPTEAEWEYAARGGNNHDGYEYSGSNTAGDVGWYSSNETHPVGGKSPNSLGLYDMAGNVWEWCFDWYGSDYYSSTSLVDPEGPDSGSDRVLRGGSWGSDTSGLRCANRGRLNPANSGSNLGFRVVVSSF